MVKPRTAAALGGLALLLGCGGKAVPAVANAVVGGTLYVTAGGCKIAGCPTNLQCNTITERCEKIPCGTQGCGLEMRCDVVLDRCVPKGS